MLHDAIVSTLTSATQTTGKLQCIARARASRIFGSCSASRGTFLGFPLLHRVGLQLLVIVIVVIETTSCECSVSFLENARARSPLPAKHVHDLGGCLLQPEIHRVGPELASWTTSLNGNPIILEA